MSQSVIENPVEAGTAPTVAVPEMDAALRNEWLAAIERLYADVTQWVSELPGWSVTRDPDKEIQEERFGTYTVLVLRILSETPDEELVLEPIGRFPRDREGIMKLYGFPSFYRVQLFGNADGSSWRVRTASNIILRQEWNKEKFFLMAKDLLGKE